MNSHRLAALAALLVATPAQAGGLFLPARGVRPAARGGSFVAGADDVGALWYNPAGLAELAGGRAKTEILVDAALVAHHVTYTRIDSGGVTQPAVDSDPEVLPIPTLAAAYDLSPRMVVGAGVLVPYTALDGYPEDGAQRYSLVSLHGSLMVIGELALAARVGERLRVGVGVQNLFLAFRSQVVFSSCPRETLCAPEDPEFDAFGQIQWNDAFNPSGVAGVQYLASPKLRLGAAVQLPFWLDSGATVQVRLPPSEFFQGARIVGDRAGAEMTLPAAVRAGAEVRPSPRWRVEGGLEVEFWSQHDDIVITPQDIRVEDQAGVGIYDLGPLVIPRRMKDTYAFKLGVEGRPSRSLPLTVRAGYAFETGAAPTEYLSVITVDAAKHLLAVGAGWTRGGWRLDGFLGYVAVAGVDVAAGTSCAPQLNPIRSGEDPPPPAGGEECVHDGDPDHVYVGDGSYRSSWLLFGAGVAVDL